MDTERREKVFRMFAEGFTYAAIAKEIGTSRQYVQQLVRPPIQIVNALRERANNKCERCGIVLRVGDGHVHHTGKVYVKRFDELHLLRYLCRSCHKIEDAAVIDEVIRREFEKGS